MVGLYVVLSFLVCVLDNTNPVGAYHLTLRDEGGVPPSKQVEESGVPEGEVPGRNGEEEPHNQGNEHYPSNENQATGSVHNNNEQEVGGYPNKQGGPSYPNNNVQGSLNQQQVPSYQQGAPQVPNYQQGVPQASGVPPGGTYQQQVPQVPNYQQGVPQVPAYQHQNPQVPNYQLGDAQYPTYNQGMPQVPTYTQVGQVQGVPQAPSYQQLPNYQPVAQAPTYQQVGQVPGVPQAPTYQQLPNYQPVGQAPNYQLGTTNYIAPGPVASQPVLSAGDPEELVKDKSESELRKLVAKALKEMKDIAEKVMFWHHLSHKDDEDGEPKHGHHVGYLPPNVPQQPPQPVFTNPPVAGPPQYYNQIPQYQPNNNMQTYPQPAPYQPVQQPYGIPPNTGLQPQSYQPPPQSYGGSTYTSPFRQPQQSPMLPSETLEYQRLVQRLFSYLQASPGQPEVNQQYYYFKLWSAPQQQVDNQITDLQPSSNYNSQQQLSNPITIPDSLVKSFIQSLPAIGASDKTYTPPSIHVPPGVVVVAPTHYITPVPKTPEVSMFRSHLQYGVPILVHDNVL